MSLSDDARTAIANVTADPDDFTAGGRTIALACADEILAAVMPDGRTIAQHLDEVDRLRAENEALADAAIGVWLDARLKSAVDTDWIVSGTAMDALRNAIPEVEADRG